MLRFSPKILGYVWLPLAAWLALWPAAESKQAAARERMPLRTMAVRGGCCRAEARTAAQTEVQTADAGPRGCCAERREQPARPPMCPEGGNARCAPCFGAGGPLLIAHALTVPDPERNELGAIRHGDHVAVSRDLRPPVPPPRLALIFSV